jgi:RHS repeat-associated protein
VNVPDENPSSLGMFEFPLRFPGQYADKGTNLFYNYFRDCYDPLLGRYCESDPIGLDGGINTYEYVRSSPLRYSDPTGESPALSAGILLGVAGISIYNWWYWNVRNPNLCHRQLMMILGPRHVVWSVVRTWLRHRRLK